jgi:hypothetical protein
LFNRSKRHIKTSAKVASLYALAAVAIGVITELTGYKKYRTTPEPKSITEVAQEWPFFIIIGLGFFVVMLLLGMLKD